MVKFRGIEISIVSQFDIRRLPEFAHRTSPVSKFDATSASCYVPIYPGSQIWFEYLVDGPHPPNAAYFFKLFVNSYHITSWDCTAENGYYGKVNYCLQHSRDSEGIAHGYASMVERRAFQFSNREEDEQQLITLNDDCIEICVYRIEHRQRIWDNFEIPKEQLSDHYSGKLKLVNGGILEPARPRRRYKYQLLDPLDSPCARFRFFYRTFEWLESHGLVPGNDTVADESSNSSTIWYDPTQIDLTIESSPSGYGTPDYSLPWILSSPEQSPVSSPARRGISIPPKNMELRMPDIAAQLRKDPDPRKHLRDINYTLSLGSADESTSSELLSLVTKGSIEDLPSTVPRSPQSPKKRVPNLQGDTEKPDLQPSNHVPIWASRGYFASALRSAAHHGGSGNDKSQLSKPKEDRDKKIETTENATRRPLSPFTSGGFLKRLRTPTPTQFSLITEKTVNEAKAVQTTASSHWSCIEGDMKADATPGCHEQTGSANTTVTAALGNLKKMFSH